MKTAEGYPAQTVQDQLGAFAVIALMAAGLGIINILLKGVRELPRETDPMKARCMGGGRVYTLFSLEAILIGFPRNKEDGALRRLNRIPGDAPPKGRQGIPDPAG